MPVVLKFWHVWSPGFKHYRVAATCLHTGRKGDVLVDETNQREITLEKQSHLLFIRVDTASFMKMLSVNVRLEASYELVQTM